MMAFCAFEAGLPFFLVGLGSGESASIETLSFVVEVVDVGLLVEVSSTPVI